MLAGGRFAPRVLLLLPTLGFLAVIVAVLFGWGARPARYAEVHGGPTDTATGLAVRLFVAESVAEVVSPLQRLRVIVTWDGPSSQTSVEATTDEEGWVELHLPRPLGANGVALTVREAESGETLAHGIARLTSDRWARGGRRRDGRLSGADAGSWGIVAHVREGVLSYPFVGHVEAHVRGVVPGEELELEVEGAELMSARSWRVADGPAIVALRPRQHAVSLRWTVRSNGVSAGGANSVSSGVPLVPGAGAVEARADGWLVKWPHVRSHVWYAVVSEGARLAGGRLALGARADGTSDALLPSSKIEIEPAGRPRWLVVSSTADARSAATVGFPLDGQLGTFDAWDARWLDGRPLAMERERARSSRLRLWIYSYVAVVTAATLLLVGLEVRRASRDLRERMARAGVIEGGAARISGGVALVSLCVVVAFSACLL
ncbi:MAG TPA: hypothetical protein VLC09_02300, partial [Polyangiaceae bacterium]|nr:hypothetical protein [Polyangiaceae bacterium]